MIKKEVTIISKVGLHARPATQVITLAKKFSSDIQISKGGTSASAKSMIALLTLGVKCNDVVELIVDGPDEKEASAELYTLMSSTMGD